MQATDPLGPLGSGSSLSGETSRARLRVRIADLGSEVAASEWTRLAALMNDEARGSEVPFEDLSEQPEIHGENPLSGAIERESKSECARVYLTYLYLYLKFYGMLSERERAALHMVEVQEHSYRQAADELGIKLENLKMVIFRARRKIHRAMR